MPKTYHEQINLMYTKKLKILLTKLPSFLKQFFIGIDQTTAPRTQVAYATDIKTFFEFIHSENPSYHNINISDYPLTILTDLKASDFEEYMNYLKVYFNKQGVEQTNQERGIKRKMSSLRCMYHYYHKNLIINENPILQVSMPKLHDKAIIRFDVDETARFLDEVESGNDLTKHQKIYHNKNKLRDVAILTLMLGTGLRVSECVGIDLNDLDFDNSRIKIIRKGGYESYLYFSDEVESCLLSYLTYRKTMVPVSGHENAFFLSSQGRRICVRTIELMVKKYSNVVTPSKRITPHKLRSTYGTSLYRETGDIYLVADVLGHKDINTTKKHYAAIDEDRRRSARNIVKLRDNKDD